MQENNNQSEENTREENEEQSENESESEQSGSGQGQRVAIDLSENEIYRGICTLLEDEEGNNILEYISLLHTELIGINKSLENLRLIRKDISRLTDCVELFFKGKSDDSLPKKKKGT